MRYINNATLVRIVSWASQVLWINLLWSELEHSWSCLSILNNCAMQTRDSINQVPWTRSTNSSKIIVSLPVISRWPSWSTGRGNGFTWPVHCWSLHPVSVACYLLSYRRMNWWRLQLDTLPPSQPYFKFENDILNCLIEPFAHFVVGIWWDATFFTWRSKE